MTGRSGPIQNRNRVSRVLRTTHSYSTRITAGETVTIRHQPAALNRARVTSASGVAGIVIASVVCEFWT